MASNDNRLRFEPLLERLALSLLRGVSSNRRPKLATCLSAADRGGDSQAARNQKVAGVAVSDFLDLAGFGHVGDVLFKKNLHSRIRPHRIEQMC